MWLILVDFRVFDGLLLDDDNEGPAVVFCGRWNTLLAYRNTLTKDKHYSCLQYHFCHLTCFALLVSSLVCTFTLFRNAISQVELHVVAPEWLQFAVVVEQHLHSTFSAYRLAFLFAVWRLKFDHFRLRFDDLRWILTILSVLSLACFVN